MAGKTYNFNALAESRMDKDVVAIIKSLFGYLGAQPWATPIWPGSGWRTGSSDHQSGRAVDIMISPKVNQRPTSTQKAAGDTLVTLLIKNAKALGIQWILFSKDGVVTWSYNLDRGSWNKLGNRGSISANHIDHVHVYFKTTAKLPANFSWGKVVAPNPPSTGGPGPKPPVVTPKPPVTQKPSTKPKLVNSVSVSVLKAARYADPPKSGTPVGPSGDQVWTLETALVKTKWLRPEHLDGHYGTSTIGDGSSGFGGVTGFQKKHSGATKPDGWLGKKELELLFKLAGMSVKVVS